MQHCADFLVWTSSEILGHLRHDFFLTKQSCSSNTLPLMDDLHSTRSQRNLFWQKCKRPHFFPPGILFILGSWNLPLCHYSRLFFFFFICYWFYSTLSLLISKVGSGLSYSNLIIISAFSIHDNATIYFSDFINSPFVSLFLNIFVFW